MKRSLLSIIIMLIGMVCCVFVVAAICKNMWIEDTAMPEIVFYYKSVYPSQYSWAHNDGVVGFIDKNGNAYCTTDAKIRRYDFEELYEKYVSGELEEDIELVGTFAITDLQEKYVLTKKVASNKEFELQYADSYSWIVPDEYWYGIYYDAHGEKQMVMLYQFGSQTYRSTDERADEIYNWMFDSLNRYNLTE